MLLHGADGSTDPRAGRVPTQPGLPWPSAETQPQRKYKENKPQVGLSVFCEHVCECVRVRSKCACECVVCEREPLSYREH